MTKTKLFFILMFAFLLVGCPIATTPTIQTQIRFVNSTSVNDPFELLYGIRIGNAVHNNALLFESTTSYYNIEPGNYTSVDIKSLDGSWSSAANGFWTIENENRYSLTIVGSFTEVANSTNFNRFVRITKD